MIPALPIDFAFLASEGVNILGVIIASAGTVVIVLALCRMGFKFVVGVLTGTYGSDKNYEFIIETNDGRKIGVWSGDYGAGNMYFFDEDGNTYEANDVKCY